MVLWTKGVFVLVFLIGRASAADYDINEKFSEIFNDIETHIERIWKWMQLTANQGLAGINHIFAVRKPTEQRQYKYQDVIDQEDLSAASAQSAGKEELSTSAPITSTYSAESGPEMKSNSNSIYSGSNSKEGMPKPQAQVVEQSNNQSPDVETADSDECDTFPPPETENSQQSVAAESVKSESQSETEIAVQGTFEKSAKSETAISEESAKSETAISEESTKSETESLAEQEPAASETESPRINGMPEAPKIMKDFQPIIIDDTPEEQAPTEKIKIGDIERYKYNDHVKRIAPASVVYEQQNIIIMFLFFLMIIMGIYFFLLSKTQTHCPTIVIGELNGNLKPNIKK